jgi:CXCXC repeat
MTAEIKKRTDALNKDFEAWNEKNNPSFTCKVKCTANNEVFDERNCKCVVITDYEKLPGTLNNLSGLRDRIKKLTIDDKNRGTFNENV